MDCKDSAELKELASLKLEALLEISEALRNKFRGDRVELCSIVNAKSGLCPEDCVYCAQSIHHRTHAPIYPLIEPEKALSRAKAMEETGVANLSFVTSGDMLDDETFASVLELMELVRSHTRLKICASLGKLTRDRARKLRELGLNRYHHNLETGPRFFPRVCSTHSFQDRIRTIELAQEEGLRVCSGMLMGLGESMEDRIELILVLKKLCIDSIPFNVLIPIPGTPLEGAPIPSSEEVLRTLALLRIALPQATIRLCAGREKSLGKRQVEALKMCADGLMVGGYLTTQGATIAEDLSLIGSAGLKVCR